MIFDIPVAFKLRPNVTCIPIWAEMASFAIIVAVVLGHQSLESLSFLRLHMHFDGVVIGYLIGYALGILGVCMKCPCDSKRTVRSMILLASIILGVVDPSLNSARSL